MHDRRHIVKDKAIWQGVDIDGDAQGYWQEDRQKLFIARFCGNTLFFVYSFHVLSVNIRYTRQGKGNKHPRCIMESGIDRTNSEI
jgi:hypothetical protein